jgi:hypothetical protein
MMIMEQIKDQAFSGLTTTSIKLSYPFFVCVAGRGFVQQVGLE